MELRDALFYWLQMKLVCEARPEDQAAKDTLAFFEQILSEDHALEHYRIAESDTVSIHVSAESRGQVQSFRFDREMAEQLLGQIESNPKYNC
ncbi:hypothetical protein [Paenibacillus senegalensis]|uniref:hypothetical protein n=1 Tax=Paenibacillus senegalensis TaxID=1465766 RepID=UPI00028A157F|nr:hypothetical protein [Paenibacillus senegalensis]